MAQALFPHNKITVVCVTLAITVFLLLLSTQVIDDMFGIFKKYDVHLSPEVNGVITNQGKPIVGLEVFRGLTYGDNKELVDKAVSDSEGRFSFAEKNIRSRKPGSMFDESRVRQIIDIDYQGSPYLLWGTIMIGIKPNQVLSKKLHYLNCDLKNKEEYFEFESIEYPDNFHGVQSVCRWSNLN